MQRQVIGLTLFAAVSLPLAANASEPQAQATGQETSKNKAQATKPAIPPGMRLLNVQEGRAIAENIAWADDEEGLSPDCSHLVHTLYEQAGYSYPYASSLALYTGSDNFARVKVPHPGDLIVWRGHVGIVVDPKEHSFFSSVSEGARRQYYNSPYWRARGHARFYRYLTTKPAKSSGTTTVAANKPAEPGPKTQADSRSADSRPTLQAVKTAPAATSKPRGEVAPVGVSHNASNSVPVALQTSGPQPKAAEVAAALAAANRDAGEILRTGNLEQLERPVVVYRDLQVSSVEVRGKRATAQVQIETLAAISREQMESQEGREEHQVELQRSKKGWVMTLANEAAYVPRDSAMRILAERLAALTQDAKLNTEKEHEQAQIIRFLNLLVE
ncbi:MAG TPA: NlpC/P60 family protein [Candidatus Acidoferrum sp.]|jgi:hypothetical protein|nr:NlpC/P60 family protein [Candidatus Acidoferrum sp.]